MTTSAWTALGSTTALVCQTVAAAFAFATLIAISACSSNPQPGTPGGDATKGASVTQAQVESAVNVCSSCHGFGGRSTSPTFPDLAGQRANYIESQLKAFRDHTRADPHAHTYMWGMAAHLSDQLIEGLATYYAAQTPAPGTTGDPAEIAAGKIIFQNGTSATGVPPCQTCHGAHAEGMAAFPRLAGQHRDYLVKQLQNFTSNARENAVMHANAMNLSAKQIREVTAYLAAQ